MNKYKFSDNVIGRIAQIVQEGMLLGVDVVDLMRQIQVEPGQNGELELTPEYVKSVVDMHVELLEDAEKLQTNSNSAGKLIFNG